ncbi:peptidylprolyl cis-trans isomerase, FKBP-type [Geotalea daltonii FRC-32]|uniref:Peptidyl-prolyl cis-trans isomerase n=1 Tax=Geotalea daltonii (strain DSM 22248 / JCM 15807 / FRC-32) TaxID=316067 RepID=B9LYX3_GEODF|nr:FKBP-type peptidyl-prolyl cis-trans isomerase [Geotalea daltonii]ACM18705.1 peptidylprolyl cis-trans isomerase, FKBP-type [Geotalea daltonii FRC-32]
MRAEMGKRVTISFVCRLEDGTLYDFTEATMLSFIVGQGHTLPSLDAGVIGMSRGEHRTIRLPATEVDAFPLVAPGTSSTAGIPAGSSRAPNGYEFAPGADGDAVTPSQPHSRWAKPRVATGAWLVFHVKLLKVEDV